MPDPFKQKVYLRSLGGTPISTRYSAGAQRRAAQLGRFIGELHEAAAPKLHAAAPHLLVVNRRDWKKLFSYPYGFSFARETKQSNKDNSDRRVSIVAAADYPERLLHRFDAVLVRAAKEKIMPPGELREFFDLFIGQQWGYAAANLAGLRTRVRWLDELFASYLFLLTLSDLGWDDMAQRFVVWSELQHVGSSSEPLVLSDFTYPRAKTKFDKGLWFQGTLTCQANELVQRHGWTLLVHLEANRATSSQKLFTAELQRLDPKFSAWLDQFNAAPQED